MNTISDFDEIFCVSSGFDNVLDSQFGQMATRQRLSGSVVYCNKLTVKHIIFTQFKINNLQLINNNRLVSIKKFSAVRAKHIHF